MRGRRSDRWIALGLVLLAGTCGWGVGLKPAAAQTAAPVKIGVLAPLTGGTAVVGKGSVNGIRLRLKELNNEMAGRKVELIVEDDAAIRPPGSPRPGSSSSGTRWTSSSARS